MGKYVCLACVLSLIATQGAFAQPCWVASGAPIGDSSIFSYPAPATLNMSHPISGENITISAITGSPSGAHIYLIDEQPMIYSGICTGGSMVSTSGVSSGSNDRYFGVFLANGTSPTYTVVYDYSGNPVVTPAIEANLILGGRSDNSVNPWSDLGASLNTTANTLTKTGESDRGEYILGISTGVLPVELLEFDAFVWQGDKVKCEWSTATEISNDYFEVERSVDGINYEKVAQVDGAGNSQSYLYYTTIDPSPHPGVSFYRLKQVDFDGTYTYTEPVPVQFTDVDIVSTFPNPADDYLNLLLSTSNEGSLSIDLVDISGRAVLSSSRWLLEGVSHVNLNVASVASGVYSLQIQSERPGSLVSSHRIVIR